MLLAQQGRGPDAGGNPIVLLRTDSVPAEPRMLADSGQAGRLRVLREGGLQADARAMRLLFRSPMAALPPREAARRSTAGFRGPGSVARVVSPGTMAPITLHLFPDSSVTILPQRVVDRVDSDAGDPAGSGAPRGRSLHGVLIAGAEGTAVLSEYGGFVSGSVRLSSGEFYEFDLQPAADAEVLVDGIRPARGTVRQLEYDGMPPGVDDVVLPEDDDNWQASPAAPRAGNNEAGILERAHQRFSGTPVIVTVAAYYTKRVLSARNGQNGLFAYLGRVEEESNEALRNSEMEVEYRFVSTSLVDLDDSRSNMSYSHALTTLRSVFDVQPHPRSRLAALFVNPPLPTSGSFTVGIAFLRLPLSGPQRHSVTHHLFAGGLSLTFAHEVGHNFGCVHDIDNSGTGGGLYGDSRGYQQRSSEPKFYTIMAYSCSGCRAVPYYSEPRVLYETLPVGTASARCAATIAREAADESWMGMPPSSGCPIEVSPSSLSLSGQAQDLQVEVRTRSGCDWQVEADGDTRFAEVLDGSLQRKGPDWLRLRVSGNFSSEERVQILSVRGFPLRIRQQPLSAGTIGGEVDLLRFSASNLPDSSQERCVFLDHSDGDGVASVVLDGAPVWLAADRSVVALPGFLCIRVNPRATSTGLHRASVLLRSNADAAIERLIPVELRVASTVPRLLYSPRAFAFDVPLGDSTSAAQWLEASGPVGLEFHALSGPPAWLRVERVESSEGARARVWADATGLAAGVYSARLLIQCGDDSCAPRVLPVRLAVKHSPASGPRIAPGGIVNAASFSQGMSVGSWVSIFGDQLAPTTRGWNNDDFDDNILPRNLDGVSVRVSGILAPVSFISPGQVNFLCPNLTSFGWVPVEIITPSGGASHWAFLEAENPGIFLMSNSEDVAALHEDATPAAMEGSLGEHVFARAARPGDLLSIYGTGFGETIPRVPTGLIYQGDARLPSSAQTRVFIGGLRADVLFAGQSAAGLNQLNVRVPALPPGEHPVRVVIGSAPSPWRGILRVE